MPRTSTRRDAATFQRPDVSAIEPAVRPAAHLHRWRDWTRYAPVSHQICVLGSDAEPLRNSPIRRGNSIRKPDKRYSGVLWIRRLKVRILPPQPNAVQTHGNWAVSRTQLEVRARPQSFPRPAAISFPSSWVESSREGRRGRAPLKTETRRAGRGRPSLSPGTNCYRHGSQSFLGSESGTTVGAKIRLASCLGVWEGAVVPTDMRPLEPLTLDRILPDQPPQMFA
jgi:hypothetical protein